MAGCVPAQSLRQRIFRKLVFPAPNPPGYDINSCTILDDGTPCIVVDRRATRPHATTHWLVFYSHGNQSDAGSSAALLVELIDALQAKSPGSVSFICYDYRGYGLDRDRPPSELGCNAAAQSAYDYATTSLGFETARILLYGTSLGAAPTLELALKNQVQLPVNQRSSVLLQSPFTSLDAVLSAWWPLNVIIFPSSTPANHVRFDNLGKISKVANSITILHGDADELVPIGHSTSLNAEIAGESRLVVFARAGHNDITNDKYRRRWVDLVEQTLFREPIDPMVHVAVDRAKSV